MQKTPMLPVTRIFQDHVSWGMYVPASVCRRMHLALTQYMPHTPPARSAMRAPHSRTKPATLIDFSETPSYCIPDARLVEIQAPTRASPQRKPAPLQIASAAQLRAAVLIIQIIHLSTKKVVRFHQKNLDVVYGARPHALKMYKFCDGKPGFDSRRPNE
ncbi:hypothetical protein C8R44DRAFT_889953 [Mycena epipterygia]|nr:hypothetical protein C8R44DRAFT_889953 [Mycena epipterygia]